jgi:hypothetical protein
LKLKVTQELGEGKAMGIFSLAEKIGQVIAPMIFGVLIVAADIGKVVTYFGLAYILITILFFLLAQSDKKLLE